MDGDIKTWKSGFKNARLASAKRTLFRALAYGCIALAAQAVLAAFEGSIQGSIALQVIAVVLANGMALFAFVFVGPPFYEWISNANRMRALRYTRTGADFLSWVQRDCPPFVLYLRDYVSWSQPKHIQGAMLSHDPLIRELSWIVPTDVSVVVLHNLNEAVTAARNIVTVLCTADTWQPIARTACEFASMIVLAPRQGGPSLAHEVEWIVSSAALRRKTLLLYEAAGDPFVDGLRSQVRWSAELWRPATGDKISGLGALPEELELVEYTRSTLQGAAAETQDG
ncbi:MAG: hypothetical protein IH605_06635 [Burkholderiales bacterium]|nr:hypothetical protein [Burkholderiales bacterium]